MFKPTDCLASLQKQSWVAFLLTSLLQWSCLFHDKGTVYKRSFNWKGSTFSQLCSLMFKKLRSLCEGVFLFFFSRCDSGLVNMQLSIHQWQQFIVKLFFFFLTKRSNFPQDQINFFPHCLWFTPSNPLSTLVRCTWRALVT